MDARNRTCKGNLYVALFYIEKRATKTYYFNHYQEHAIRDSKKKTFNLPPLEAFSTVGDCVIFILLT